MIRARRRPNTGARACTLRLLLVLGFAGILYSCSSRLTEDRTDGRSGGDNAQDPAAQCRELAPEDPFTEKDERSEQAYNACRAAVEADPNNADLQYRLGTAALQNEHNEESLAAFRKAEQLGSCQALVFIGNSAWYEDHDAVVAENYYKRGAECGDRRAASKIFSSDTYRASAYPDKIESLYNSDIETLNRVRFLSASYVAGFYKELSEQFLSKDFDPCWASNYYRGGDILYGIKAAEKGDAPNFIIGPIYEQYLPAVYQLLLPEQGEKALDEVRETAREAGKADLIRMVQSTKCGELLPMKIVNGVEAFSKARKSLLDVAIERYPNIHSLDDLTSLLRGSR
jgi:tetratricopeptide (TPR) repeat protein